VVIVGRPNVGKSTLFNRIVGWRHAIVDSKAGSTRDRNAAPVDWAGREFELVDTGGVLEATETPLDEQVGAQVDIALGEADLIVWVVDGRSGLLPEDHYLASRLRRMPTQTLLAVNKIDTAERVGEASEFYTLGFAPLFAISAEHGLGVAELLDGIVAALPSPEESAGEGSDEAVTSIAITGRPNVGKSSLLNALTGETRAVVSEVAGTTRDAVDTLIRVEDRGYRIVDTAGIRRRGKLASQADRLGVMYAERAIARAEICLLVLDATEGVTTEDASIAGKIEDAGRGAVLVFNKWDVVEGREARAKELEAEARNKIPHLDFAPIVFVSALTGRGLHGILPRVDSVRECQNRRLSTSELNRFLEMAVERFPPRARDGREVRLFYTTQVGVSPPRFVVFGNRKGSEIDPTYPRYLSRRLREAYEFEGTPIRVILRARDQPKRQ
jgi:GTP-binding protein